MNDSENRAIQSHELLWKQGNSKSWTESNCYLTNELEHTINLESVFYLCLAKSDLDKTLNKTIVGVKTLHIFIFVWNILKVAVKKCLNLISLWSIWKKEL